MRTPFFETSADVVIVGGGVAGLAAALESNGLDVVVIHPAHDRGNSVSARGGIAAALQGDDREHFVDTCRAGAELCNRRRTKLLVREGRDRVAWLLDRGMPFDRDGRGRLALGLEAGHSRPRILHANGDATGRALVTFLADQVRRECVIRRIAGDVIDLLLDEEGRVAGVLTCGQHDALGIVRAPDVVLATGGIGALFSHTSNVEASVGDGLALALRAGAWAVDLEFVQFHPTALCVDARPMPLITEALRGAGATLVDVHGMRILDGVHPDGDLAPRDIVARTVWAYTSRDGAVYLDTRAVRDLERRFPSVVDACVQAGLSPAHIPIAPAAHYHMGGVEVDDHGATCIEGLWACGEVASTGVHGANRLASNSLLEALVFGARVGRALASGARGHRGKPNLHGSRSTATSFGVEKALPEIFWRCLGLERSGLVLRRMLEWLEVMSILCPHNSVASRRLMVAELIATAALQREESRGGHFRADFPSESEHGRGRVRSRWFRGGVQTMFVPLDNADAMIDTTKTTQWRLASC